MATRWRMPPDSSLGYFAPNPARPTFSRSVSARPRYSDLSQCLISMGSSTLSRTVRQGSSRSRWKTTPISVCGLTTNLPSRVTRPPEGSNSPAISINSVLLPQPLGPTTETKPPGAMDRSNWRRASIASPVCD